MDDGKVLYGGKERTRTGCHWNADTSGTWMNSHWPAVYLKLGLLMRSSIAPLG